MAQQVIDRDSCAGRAQLHVAVVRMCHLHLGKCGQVARYRVTEEQAPLLYQLHGGYRYQRFGHRINAKNRVAGHGRAAGRVALAYGFVQDHFAFAGNQCYRAGQAPFGDFGLQNVQEARAARRVKA